MKEGCLSLEITTRLSVNVQTQLCDPRHGALRGVGLACSLTQNQPHGFKGPRPVFFYPQTPVVAAGCNQACPRPPSLSLLLPVRIPPLSLGQTRARCREGAGRQAGTELGWAASLAGRSLRGLASQRGGKAKAAGAAPWCRSQAPHAAPFAVFGRRG